MACIAEVLRSQGVVSGEQLKDEDNSARQVKRIFYRQGDNGVRRFATAIKTLPPLPALRH
jgi:hypothetical protein